MFWRVTSLAQSPVEAILDKGDFTLADLLDEDDVIQEARALNGRLVSFLAKRETVKQLLCRLDEEGFAAHLVTWLQFKDQSADHYAASMLCSLDSVRKLPSDYP